MITFMIQYQWENINKATQNACLTCPTCLEYSPGKPLRTVPRCFKYPNRPWEAWQVDFIQLPPCHEYTYVLVLVVCFLMGLELSLASKLLPVLWLTSFWKRLFLPRELFSNSMVIRKHILQFKCFDKSVLFGWFYNTSTVLTTVSLGLVKCTDGIFKTQLTKVVETLQILWST